MPVVALAYLLVVPAKPSQTVYRLKMKESLRRRLPLNGANVVTCGPCEGRRGPEMTSLPGPEGYA
jgi:hypothetical protein